MEAERKVDPETGEIIEGIPELLAETKLPIGTALIKVLPSMDVAVRNLGDEALKLSMYANKMTVTNLEEEKGATNDLVMCRDMIKQTETEQKRWLEPVRDAEAKIKAVFALILTPLKNANEALTTKITKYRQEEKRKADEAAEIARKEAELAAMKAKAEGKEPPPVVEIITSEQVKTHHAEIGTTTMAGTWKFRWKHGLSQREILERLPLQYHLANETLIGQMVRAKAKNGVTEKDFGDTIEIYLEEGIRITGKRG